MRIDLQRLLARLDRLARIGGTPSGGVTRLALTDEDRAARDLLRTWMEEAGLVVRIDDFGNMVGRREGTDPEALPVQLGSHCDSVPSGGAFDGTLGVLGALEVVQTVHDAGILTRRPLEVINWTNEEGARFQPPMLGSGAVSGRFDKSYVYARTDAEGRSFAAELERIGYLGREGNRPGPGVAYLELHIEQGPVLEAEGVPVGVVEGIVGITWCEVAVLGKASHAGTTPLPMRHDALLAASQLVERVQRLAREAGPPALGTVGRLQVEPNAVNVVPGRVTFSVDFRHPTSAGLDWLVAQFEAAAIQVAAETGTVVHVDRYWTSEPTPFDPQVVSTVERVVQRLGLPYRRLWSGAGHDAKYRQDICPTGMVFVRSRDGLSHCPQEYSAPEDIEAGVTVLLHTTLELANR
ncbi:MAG: Zn-dependent hydrolase [Thermomicrobium sp.]|nr:Zn-dependent hydrolase [Thermomicrobium sp.]